VVAIAVAAVALGLRALAVVRAGVSDVDVWWVAAAGRWMIEHRAVPRANLFSYTAPDHPWVMHEWLLGVPYVVGLDALGPRFFVAVAAIAGALGGGIVLAGTIARAKRPAAGAILALVAIVVFAGRLGSARPIGIALLLAAATWLVASAPRFGRGHVAGAALLALVWTNAHGSFPLGWGLLGAAALDAPREKLRWLALALAIALSFAQPYGLDLHHLVFEYLAGTGGAPEVVRAHLVEFRPAWELAGSEVLSWDRVGALALIVALALVGVVRGPARAASAAALVLAGLGAASVRHLDLAGTLGAMMVLPALDGLVAKDAPPPMRRGIVPAAAALVAAWALALIAAGGPRDWTRDLGGDALPRIVAGIPAGGRTYAPFPLSGRAVWLGASVFHDPRNDCYPPEIVRDALRMHLGAEPPERVREILAAARTEWAIAIEDSPVDAALEGHATLVASDGAIHLYDLESAR
jgi:hypothetical protein